VHITSTHNRLRAALQGLQSDEEYAEVFVRSKWRQQQKAPRMILMVGLAQVAMCTVCLGTKYAVHMLPVSST
jgi:hypothetical protein